MCYKILDLTNYHRRWIYALLVLGIFRRFRPFAIAKEHWFVPSFTDFDEQEPGSFSSMPLTPIPDAARWDFYFGVLPSQLPFSTCPHIWRRHSARHTTHWQEHKRWNRCANTKLSWCINCCISELIDSASFLYSRTEAKFPHWSHLIFSINSSNLSLSVTTL